jgi:hypothetical protein
VDVDCAVGSSFETGLHQLIILAKVRRIKSSSTKIVGQELPRDS